MILVIDYYKTRLIEITDSNLTTKENKEAVWEFSDSLFDYLTRIEKYLLILKIFDKNTNWKDCKSKIGLFQFFQEPLPIILEFSRTFLIVCIFKKLTKGFYGSKAQFRSSASLFMFRHRRFPRWNPDSAICRVINLNLRLWHSLCQSKVSF